MKKCLKTICVSSLCLAASIALSEMQTWNSTAGTALQAEFVSRSGSTVTLRSESGKTLMVSLSALTAESQAQLPQEAAKPATALSSNSGPKRIGGIEAPSAEVIASFKTTSTEADGTKYDFYGRLGPQTLNKKAQSSAFKTGKIPFRVTSAFSKSKLVGGKTRSENMSGTAYIVVLNEAGEVVDSKRENLLKLCPS